MKKLKYVLLATAFFIAVYGQTRETVKTGSAVSETDSIYQTDLTPLYERQDSLLRLYRQSEARKDYAAALRYNEAYRRCKDSVTQIVRERELRVIRAEYEYVRLEDEKNQLALQKIKIQKNALILLAAILTIVFLIFFFYRWRLLRQKQAIRQATTRLPDYHASIRKNESAIQTNKEITQILRRQMARQDLPDEENREQQDAIDRIYRENERLQQQNEQINHEIQTCAARLEDGDMDYSAFEWLENENRRLSEKEKELFSILLGEMELTGRLKTTAVPLTPEEKTVLFSETEVLFPGFITSLRKEFPILTEDDLFISCLILLQFSVPEIAEITGMEAASVSKRKGRIKERMKMVRPEIWEKEVSLDTYIWKYGDETYI